MPFTCSSLFRALPTFALALFTLLVTNAVRAEPTPAAASPPFGGERAVEVATGRSHSCALVESGLVWCWGSNAFGQLGSGQGFDNQLTPVQVAGLTGITQITLGDDFSCALGASREVFCWGRNHRGQLGNGHLLSPVPTAVRVQGLTAVTQISAGRLHACALRSTGRIFCWGDNARSQLGDGTFDLRTVPVRAIGPFNSHVSEVAAGGRHTCLRRRASMISCWGDNTWGQLGDGTFDEPASPGSGFIMRNVTQLALGNDHSCALRKVGRVFCWGSNEFGELGNGGMGETPNPVRVSGLSMAGQIAAGGNDGHSCAVRDTGRVFCWGANFFGQLGDDSNTDRLVPVRVVGMGNAVRVATGGAHSCGVRLNGQVRCWGSNVFGQLGDGTTTNRWRAVPVGGG